MKSRSTARPFIAAVLFTAALWTAGGATATSVGCTPKREAALADQAARKARCAVENLDRTPEQMLLDCAIPKDAQDVQDWIDIFVGAQAGAVGAGASLPHAQPGMRGPAPDGGADGGRR